MTDSQLDLLSRAAARRGDPITAKEAGAAAAEWAIQDERPIMTALVALGVPVCANEIARWLGWFRGERNGKPIPDNVRVSRRLARMRDNEGWVYSFDGKDGRPSIRHEKQTCHVATAKGRALVREAA